MKRTFINLAKEKSRGISALQGTNVPAVFCDAVRIDLAECAMIYISGKIGVDEAGKIPRTMAEQTRQCIRNMRTVLEVAGGTLEDIVRSWSTQPICASSRKLWRRVPSFLWPSCRRARLWR